MERAFRGFDTDLDIRPIRHHQKTGSVRTCSCGCFSYYVTFHMERQLAPVLFKDDDTQTAEAARTTRARSPQHVAPTGRAQQDPHQAHRGRRAGPQLRHLAQDDLAAITANKIQPLNTDLPVLFFSR